MHDVACEFACAVRMRSSNGRERPQVKINCCIYPKIKITLTLTLTLLLKIGSKCLDLGTVPTNLKVFLRGLLNMREKQILTSVIEFQKENWG